MKKRIIAAAAASITIVLALAGCGAKNETASESMEAIQNANGVPVVARELKPREFSVYRKYPAALNARSESTAYAPASDVVRQIDAKVGDHVLRDQLIVRFSSDNSTYQQAAANFANAEAAFKRSSTLFSQAGISRQEYDNVRTQYEVARASLKSASDLIGAKAPIEGVITRIAVRETQNVSAGAELFTVTNSGGYESRIYATVDEVRDLRVGQRAYAELRGARLEGRVTEVSLVMDRAKKAFPATVTFSADSAGAERGLASGIACDVSVEVYRSGAAIVVSRSELTRSGEGWSALVVSDGKAESRPVTLGRDDGAEFEVASGLSAGDLLISEAKAGIPSGTKVVPAAAE